MRKPLYAETQQGKRVHIVHPKTLKTICGFYVTRSFKDVPIREGDMCTKCREGWNG